MYKMIKYKSSVFTSAICVCFFDDLTAQFCIHSAKHTLIHLLYGPWKLNLNVPQCHLFIYLLLYIDIVTYVTLDLSNYISQKNYNTYTTSQTVTAISYPYRVIKQQFPCTVQSNAHSKIH